MSDLIDPHDPLPPSTAILCATCWQERNAQHERDQLRARCAELEKDNADLRHDIARHVQACAEKDQRIDELDHHIDILLGRTKDQK